MGAGPLKVRRTFRPLGLLTLRDHSPGTNVPALVSVKDGGAESPYGTQFLSTTYFFTM